MYMWTSYSTNQADASSTNSASKLVDSHDTLLKAKFVVNIPNHVSKFSKAMKFQNQLRKLLTEVPKYWTKYDDGDDDMITDYDDDDDLPLKQYVLFHNTVLLAGDLTKQKRSAISFLATVTSIKAACNRLYVASLPFCCFHFSNITVVFGTTRSSSSSIIFTSLSCDSSRRPRGFHTSVTSRAISSRSFWWGQPMK